eukprot:TRINITY_DN9979_c0_g1_i1.p1 TRINITY_DN9979_c0_g1~~TRINITY_DN9979_c0_g1_i1.p1  ORF type:complete len:170 (+),score=6.93 TRINITY_DN9979_c0_g1_i1:41-550(+)
MSYGFYEGLHIDGHQHDNFLRASYSICWPSSGPFASTVPMPDFVSSVMKRNGHPAGQHENANHTLDHCGGCRNPMPAGGSRRDAFGPWSFGSQGHEYGLCKRPCKDVRSGQGCAWGPNCKKCHLPHPEISSTSLRSKKSKVKGMVADGNNFSSERPRDDVFRAGEVYYL